MPAYRGGTNSVVSMYDNTGVNEEREASWQATKAYLKTVYLTPYIHKAAITLSNLTLGTNAITGIHRFGNIGDAMTKVVAGVNMATDVMTSLLTPGGDTGIHVIAQESNALLDELKDPNIGGIPIHAETEVESQDSEVQQHLLIQQQESNKALRADNSVPKPRTWSLSGYLMATQTMLDTQLIIKPTLIAQRKMLQRYADLRMPVVFKTHDNRFFTVLVTHFDSQYTVNGLNALRVNITLTEFNTMYVESSSLGMTALNLTRVI